MSESPLSRIQLDEKEYVLQIAPLLNELGLLVSLSDRSLRLLPYDFSNFRSPLTSITNAHQEGIADVKSISGSEAVSCGADGVKIWDLRAKPSTSPQAHFVSPLSKHGISALDVSPETYRIAAGTEMISSDAGVHIWDIRKGSEPIVSYVDSHNDDITCVKFHPNDRNALLSGSTDGLVNIYNTSISDEDDAVYQTINHGASIHSTGFISEKRIFALSHMETFSINEVAHPDESVEEPKPLDFGDIRVPWDCEYVIDIIPGYVACGTLAKSQFKLLPFVDEVVQADSPLIFGNGHGEEVVRSLYYAGAPQLLYSCGEDGAVAVWNGRGLTNTSSSYTAWPSWDSSPQKLNIGSGQDKGKQKKSKHKKQKDGKKKERYNPY